VSWFLARAKRRYEVRTKSRGVTDIVRETRKAGKWAIVGLGRSQAYQRGDIFTNFFQIVHFA
jgi:hypothetical protein